MSENEISLATLYREGALELFKRAESTSDKTSQGTYIELASQWIDFAQQLEQLVKEFTH